MVPAAIGTETDGSITCPAAVNGIVGMKPTIGLVSRTHIVPISHSQDTAGPMTLTVRDTARVLTAMAGTDPADPATAEADDLKTVYVTVLSTTALDVTRIRALGFVGGFCTDATLVEASSGLSSRGAVLVHHEQYRGYGER